MKENAKCKTDGLKRETESIPSTPNGNSSHPTDKISQGTTKQERTPHPVYHIISKQPLRHIFSFLCCSKISPTFCSSVQRAWSLRSRSGLLHREIIGSITRCLTPTRWPRTWLRSSGGILPPPRVQLRTVAKGSVISGDIPGDREGRTITVPGLRTGAGVTTGAVRIADLATEAVGTAGAIEEARTGTGIVLAWTVTIAGFGQAG